MTDLDAIPDLFAVQETVVVPTPRKITEADFLRQVRNLARIFGWATYHPFLSKWSEKGWPDLTLIRPPRIVLAELKAEKGRVSEEQRRWLGMLGACPGVETFLWRPSDLERVAEILR